MFNMTCPLQKGTLYGVNMTCLLQERMLYAVNKDLSVTRWHVIWVNKELFVTWRHVMLGQYGIVCYKKTRTIIIRKLPIIVFNIVFLLQCLGQNLL